MKMVEVDLAEIMKNGIGRRDSDEDEPRLALPFAAQDLRDGLTALTTPHSFKIGTIVRQKASCRIYVERYPAEPAIICEILDTPMVETEQGSGSPYFNIPMDIVIGRRGENGEFLTFYVDSRRFELVPKDELTLPGDES